MSAKAADKVLQSSADLANEYVIDYLRKQVKRPKQVYQSNTQSRSGWLDDNWPTRRVLSWITGDKN